LHSFGTPLLCRRFIGFYAVSANHDGGHISRGSDSRIYICDLDYSAHALACRCRNGPPQRASLGKSLMPCLVCGSAVTCRAHILPKQAGREIIKRSQRRTLSLAVPNRMHNFIQSGLFDDQILCSHCDGKLGVYDNHAIQILRLLGTEHETINREASRFTITRSRGVNHLQLALFGAAVAWRTAVSKYSKLSGFTLGNNATWIRDIISIGTITSRRYWLRDWSAGPHLLMRQG
jgi:hypothetical protein